MTNELYILIYSSLFLISVLMLISTVKSRRRTFLSRYFTLFCMCACGWAASDMLFYVVRDPKNMEFFYNLKLVFVPFLAVAAFFAIAGFYRLDKHFPRWIHFFIYIIPVITLLIVFIKPELLTSTFQVLQMEPLVSGTSDSGTWYYVMVIYSQGLALLVMGVLLTNYSNLPIAHRQGSSLMISGMMFYMVCTILGIGGIGSSKLDVSLVGVCVGGVFFFFASLVNGKMDFLQIEQREIFDYLEEAVIVQDAEGRIVDINHTARNLMLNAGVDPIKISEPNIIQRLQEEGIISILPQHEAGEKRSDSNAYDVYIKNGQFRLVYEAQVYKMTKEDGEISFGFILLSDVTENRMLIERLQDLAGVDGLTGIPNRYGFAEALRDIDVPEFLPISVIFGDLNNLKQINDKYGHSEGDRYLREAAAALHECCADTAFIARIGGDEFVVLLPGYTEEAAADVKEEITKAVSSITIADVKCSIALGSCTKEREEENLNVLIEEADIRMYNDKKRIKQAG